MYRYGMTQWVMGNEPLEKSFERLQKCGYDDIEFAADPYGLDPERCLALMKKYGIGATSLCGMFGSDDRDLSADNADTAIRYLADSVDFALVNRVCPGDVVIMQDYGLAAMCLSRRARAQSERAGIHVG